MKLKIRETAWGINCITLSVHCADPKYDRTWTLERGGELTYRPRSFDGGYIYDFRLK